MSTPSEQFLLQLLDPYAQSLSPGEFLDYAIERLVQLDWVRGVHVIAPDGERRAGDCRGHPNRVHDDTLKLTLYTDGAPGTAQERHIQLLGRIMEQIWRAHRREADLRSQTHARAIHETGAQLTHDIKNLLQSLQTLSAVVGATPPERAGEVVALARRQLPAINHRLSVTLQKLREPADSGTEYRPLAEWWNSLRDRYPVEAGRLQGDSVVADIPVPHDLFDTVAENLLENARNKRRHGRPVDAVITVSVDDDCITLDVSDDGLPVDAAVREHLFVDTIESTSGLGIGLYQCARMAENHGFRLDLESNCDGLVLFRMRGPRPTTD